MAITIATNIASLSAQGNLATTTASLQKSFERLSSGLRITSASDDAAGLAVADNLRADQRIAGVALRNANDGISLISIADGALKEIGNILQRQGELAEQSANGTFSASQRSALQSEFVSLGNEIERIAESTEFNALKLIGSSAASVTLQIGLDAGSNSQITFSAAQGTLASLGLANAGSTSLKVAVSTSAAALVALTSVKAAIGSLTTSRGTLGAAESRLNSAISNLSVARENFAAAESAIRDVDVASEAANLTRNNILQQAGAAVLAQANQQPALALSLLG